MHIEPMTPSEAAAIAGLVFFTVSVATAAALLELAKLHSAIQEQNRFLAAELGHGPDYCEPPGVPDPDKPVPCRDVHTLLDVLAGEPLPTCQCKANDAWRCAVRLNLKSVACGCKCHNRTAVSDWQEGR